MNASRDMGNGFYHHGVAMPISNHRGLVATVDGQGRNVVLLWLYDHRGCYAILVIDAETGESEQVPLPFPPGEDFINACPFASILSSGNVFYTHFHSQFMAFDPGERAFTFCRETAPQMAMGMTEDDEGRIWSVTYPDSGVVSFDPGTGQVKELRFEYTSEGAHVMGIATAPDNTLCGGTAFPMRFFSYNPGSDTWVNRAALGQWNTVARGGDRFFIGAYTHGLLEEWDPARPWVHTERGEPGCNPRLLFECHTTINRPHVLLAHPDGRTVVLAGTPGYGYTGGGMLFWDRETESHTLLEHTDLLPEHSTMSLAALEDGNLLGGSTTNPGTGGEVRAKEAEIYLMDLETKKVLWREVVFPGVQTYTDLCPGPEGLVYGIADRKRFFVFDPERREVVREEDTEAGFGLTAVQQGPRVFVRDPDGAVYILFIKGIARVDARDHGITMLAESPVPIGPGGDWLDGHIYFGSGSHLYSYRV